MVLLLDKSATSMPALSRALSVTVEIGDNAVIMMGQSSISVQKLRGNHDMGVIGRLERLSAKTVMSVLRGLSH